MIIYEVIISELQKKIAGDNFEIKECGVYEKGKLIANIHIAKQNNDSENTAAFIKTDNENLKKILESMGCKKIDELCRLRKEIDEIDRVLCEAFVARMKISTEIGRVKNAYGVPVRDAVREEELLRKLENSAEEEFAPYIRYLYTQILTLSRRAQDAGDAGCEDAATF